MQLPQELLANALWLEWQTAGTISKKKIPKLLKQYNLKLQKGKVLDDVTLAFGRGLKDTYGKMKKQLKQIAEQIDKVCVIERWDFAVEKYCQ